MTAHTHTQSDSNVKAGVPASFVYNGEIIHRRDEMLSLTDMWRASGSDFSKQPAKWREMPSTGEFVSHVTSVILRKSEDLAFRVSRGRNGETWAHWQLAMAYAKYLSPEFHAWCNQVVIDRMEVMGRDDRVVSILAAMADRIAALEDRGHATIELPPSQSAIADAVRTELAKQSYMLRRGKTAGQIWRENRFPPLKNVAAWFGNRLHAVGCAIDNNGHGELGLSKARLFDPDRSDIWLENGGRHIVAQKIAERQGQGRLHLVGEAQ